MIRLLLRSLISIVFLAGAAAAGTTTYVIQPNGTNGVDAWISSASPYLSTGLRDTLFVGRGAGLEPVDLDSLDIEPPVYTAAAHQWRSLLRFPLPGLPPDARLVSAELAVYVEDFRPMSPPYVDPLQVGVHRVTAAWAEGTGQPFSGVNWYVRIPPSYWTRAGGDYETPAAAMDTVTAKHEWLRFDVTGLAEDWYEDLGGEHGVILAYGSGQNTIVSIPSSDYAIPSLRPALTLVVETPDPELPAFGEGVAEIVPAEAVRNAEAEFTLAARFTIEDGSVHSGVDRIFLPFPGGFAGPLPLAVRVGGGDVFWSNAGDEETLDVRLAAPLAATATVEIDFRVRTPDAPAPGGILLVPYGDDSRTHFAPQVLAEGDANGTAGDSDTYRVVVTAGPAVTIEIAPPAASLTADSILLFTAAGYDDGGYETVIDPAWTVAGGIGTIDGAGLFDPAGAGTGWVIAAEGAAAESAAVEVTPGAPAILAVTPADTSISVLSSVQFEAALFDADSNALDPAAVSWSEPTGLGSIDSDGLFLPASVGAAVIVAAAGAVSDTASLSIVPGELASLEVVPHSDTVNTEETIHFTAVARDGGGNVIDDPGPLGWSGGSSIGAINSATGLFAATTPGVDSVIVTGGPITGRSGPITVVPGPARSVTIAPPAAALAAGEEKLFIAIAYDGEGNPTGDPIDWSVTGGIGAVSGGLFTAENAGTGSVIASAPGPVSGTAPVTVFDPAGLLIEAVIESRAMVTRGEREIPVALALRNGTGGGITSLAGALRFTAGGGDREEDYAVTAIPWSGGPVPDGGRDTLRFLVDVADSALAGQAVVIDGEASASFVSGEGGSAASGAATTGSWTVGEAPLLIDVTRSLFPHRVVAGREAGFAIALENVRGPALTLGTATTFTFGDGNATFEASLTAPVALLPGGEPGICLFGGETVPEEIAPGNYPVFLHIDGEDGNGGRFEETFLAKANSLELLPPYVAVSAPAIEGTVVRPDASSVPLLRLDLVNLYEGGRTLSALRVTNDGAGPGTVAERDGIFSAIRLVADGNRNGAADGGETVLGTGSFSGGKALFAGLAFTVAGGDTAGLLVTGDLNKAKAPDGEEIDGAVAGAADLVFGGTTQVSAAFPLDSPGARIVDGFVAAQLAADAGFPPDLPAGANDSLALGLVIPSNGYRADTLRSLTVQNAGTALQGEDIVEVRLWRDGGNGGYDRGGGDDTDLGALYWTGDGWTRSGLGLPVSPGGARLFLSVDASANAVDERTLRLRVPVDGVLMASSNDGPVDAPVLAPSARVFGGARRVIAEAGGGGGETAPLPGRTDLLLFEVDLANVYPDTVRLVGLTVENLSSGDEPDSVMKRVKLYDGARIGGNPGPPLATAPTLSGRAALAGFTLPLPPGGVRTVTIGGDVGLACAADGDTVRLLLSGPEAFLFAVDRVIEGSFPIGTPSPPVVNGMAAAQVKVHGIPGGALTPTESGRLALSITVPSNGCRSDSLLGVRLVNQGTADMVDIERLTLLAGSGAGETELGDLVWNGQAWAREGIGLAVPAGGETLRVRVAASAGARDGRTLSLAIPSFGLTVASGNDGPVDGPVPAGAVLQVSTSPLFASLEIPAGPLSAGQEWTAALVAENLTGPSPDTLVLVEPDSFAVTGVHHTVLGTPANGPLVLPPGGTARFEWRLRAETPGTATLRGRARGERASDGTPVSSFLVDSDAVTTKPAPTGLLVSGVNTLPEAVSRGDRLVPLFVLTLTHADGSGSGAAPVRVDTIRVVFEDDGGGAIAARDLLRGAAVERGGAPIGLVDSASVGEGVLTLPLNAPIDIAPGETAALELLVDLLVEPSAGSFAGALPAPSAVTARNVLSGSAVPVIGPFPIRTRVASIVVPPTALVVTVREGLPPRVNRGTASVPILGVEFQSQGVPGVTADVSIRAIKILLSDGLFPFDRARVTGTGITHFQGNHWTTAAGVLTIPLSPPVIVPVGNPIGMSLTGDLGAGAPLGPFRLGVSDTVFIDPRTETDEGGVEVELLVTEPIGTIVVIPTDTMFAEGSPGTDTSAVYPGATGREAFRIAFEHPGGDTLSPVRVLGLRIRLEEAGGDSAEMRSLVARVQIRTGAVIASAAPLADGSATLSLPFSAPVALEPGNRTEAGVVVDLRADAPPGDYRFVVTAGMIDGADGITGEPVAIRFAGDDPGLYRSDPMKVRRISERVEARIRLSLPPTTVGGASGLSGISLKLTPSGGEEESELRLRGFALLVEDREGSTADPSAAFRSAVVRAGADGTETAGVFGASEIAFTFDPPLGIAPSETLAVTGDLEIADDPSLAAFRIRLPADRIELVGEGPAVEEVTEESVNPSAYAHLAERTFDGSLRNYPNPFAAGREETTIAFYAKEPGRVEIRIFTGLGVPVRSWEARIGGAGLLETGWDGRNGEGRDVISGAYLASVTVRYESGASEHGIRKIAVLR
ncbi:MAG: DNRLRE domain-containing protein [Candidatus Eisenbacteria bacterium]